MQKIITKILQIAVITAVFMPFMKAEAAPSCTLSSSGSNEIIVQLPKEVIVALVGRKDPSGNPLKNKNWATGLSVPAGKYNVVAQTYDGHSEHGGQGQTKEQLSFWLYTGASTLMTIIGPTTDIAESSDYQNTDLGNVTLSSPLSIVGIAHQHLGKATTYESVYPVCLKLTRINPPVVPNPDVTCSVSDTTLTVGQSTTFTANATGGSGSYTYNWTGTVSSTNSSVSKTFNATGTYNATITVTDSNGKTASVNCAAVVVTQSNPEAPIASCSVSDSSINKGDSVVFTGSATGGNGAYTYAWSNTVSGTGRQISKTFNSTGSYVATVTVTDGNGLNDSANCPTVVVGGVDVDEDLEVECKVSDSSIEEGDRITIKVEIDGGDGPFDIDWSGDTDEVDDFDDNARTQRVEFEDAGTYKFRVTVEDDNGNEESDTCTVRVSDENRAATTVRENTDGELASLSSVYLNQVPYTGPEETAKLIGFISLVVLWSAVIAYYALRNKNKGQISARINSFKQANLANKI